MNNVLCHTLVAKTVFNTKALFLLAITVRRKKIKEKFKKPFRARLLQGRFVAILRMTQALISLKFLK